MFPLFLITVFEKFINGFFIPHANVFRLGKFCGINVYAYLYLSLLLSFLLLVSLQKRRPIQTTPKQILFNVTITLFVVTLIFQTISQAKNFEKEFKIFNNTSLSERYTALLGNDYLFIKSCRDRFPGYHRAQLLTDMDMTQILAMYLTQVLYYHLYPIDLRVRKDMPIDVIVAFHKTQARKFIPNNFRVLMTWNEDNLMAVREDLLK